MNNPFALSERPLIPSLFQIAARTEDAPAKSKSFSRDHAYLAETMLNPRKLEAVLNAIGKKKKPAGQ
jgi:hypothetical protein